MGRGLANKNFGKSGRILAIALLAVLAFTAASAQGGEDGFEDERQTTCWPCHVAFNPPMRSMFDLLPPSENVTISGAQENFQLRIANAYTHNLTRIEVTMDLSDVQNVGFASTKEPVIGREFTGEVAPAPGYPVTGAAIVEGVLVEDGASNVTLQATPGTTGPTAPTMALAIYPGGNASGEPAASARASGPGETVTFTAGAAEILELGTGNWTVVVEAIWADALGGTAGLPQQTTYTLVQDVDFAVSGEARQTFVRSDRVPSGGASLFEWGLLGNGELSEGTVNITANVTVYYLHDDKSTDNWANVTKTLSLQLVDQDGTWILEPPAGGPTIPGGQIFVGVTMDRVSEAIGYIAGFLLIASIWSGGMFGKASKRQFNQWLENAKRRVAFHNFLSYALTVVAIVHLILFLIETNYHWTWGLLLGGIALLAMLALGVTGALQVPMIKKWSFNTWKWWHWGLAMASIVFTLLHIFLDGANFTAVADAVGWSDPLVPAEYK